MNDNWYENKRINRESGTIAVLFAGIALAVWIIAACVAWS